MDIESLFVGQKVWWDGLSVEAKAALDAIAAHMKATGRDPSWIGVYRAFLAEYPETAPMTVQTVQNTIRRRVAAL